MSEDRRNVAFFFGLVVLIILLVAVWTLDTTLTYKLLGSALVVALGGVGFAKVVE